MAQPNNRNGQGEVKDPKNDQRLKENRDRSDDADMNMDDEDDRAPGGQGRVKNPETDGRLKDNR